MPSGSNEPSSSGQGYTILGAIAKGGMGVVYLGRHTGSAGFSRLVAIKRLHPELAVEKDFVAMLVDEARLAAQIRHTNVIDTLDLVASHGAFNLVLEYVEGDSLSALVKNAKTQNEPIEPSLALAIIYGVLRGLDAAHEARSEDGHPLGIVHRDVSPQNILIGVDGIPRVIDFGVAKALGRFTSTRPGEVRGKYSYMAPEQLLGKPVTRQVDVYAAGVLLWELLTNEKLFAADDPRVISAAVLRGEIKPPSAVNPSVPGELDAIVLKATSRDLAERYLTAREMLNALEDIAKVSPGIVGRASDDDVGRWVRRMTAKKLAERAAILRNESSAAPVDSSSIEDLMADLARSAEDAAAGGIAPPPSSAMELATIPTVESPSKEVAPSPTTKLHWMGIAGAAFVFALAGTLVGVAVNRSSRSASSAPSAITPVVTASTQPNVISAATVIETSDPAPSATSDIPSASAIRAKPKPSQPRPPGHPTSKTLGPRDFP